MCHKYPCGIALVYVESDHNDDDDDRDGDAIEQRPNLSVTKPWRIKFKKAKSQLNSARENFHFQYVR